MIRKFLCALGAIALATTSHAAPAKPAIAAKSQIDARGVAALEKSVAFYQKQRSFSLNATQKVFLDGKIKRNARLQIGLQAPYRASLRTTLLDEKSRPVATGVVRLMDAKSLYLSQSGIWPTVRPVGSAREQREDGLKEIFNDVPGVSISVVVMALGYEPSRDSNIKSVSYGEIRENGKMLKSVTIARKTPADATAITAEFRLNPRSYAVEKVVFYLVIGGKTGKIVTELGAPVSNWKGSQSATDAAVYNWKTLAPEIPIATPKPRTKISVDTRARAIFARAVKLYGAAKGLKARWKYRNEDDENLVGALDFDRAGRLRLAGIPSSESLTIFNGKERWQLNEAYDTDEAGHRLYNRYEADSSDLSLELESGAGMTGGLGNLLSEINILDEDHVRSEAESAELKEFRALLLPPQPFNGQACDLVRITQISPTQIKTEPQGVDQQTFWFARSNGALVRLQDRSVIGDQFSSASDAQIIEQIFDPQFALNTFKFVPPKGARLDER